MFLAVSFHIDLRVAAGEPAQRPRNKRGCSRGHAIHRHRLVVAQDVSLDITRDASDGVILAA
eukprot:2398950-Rhodomonas_salina.1